jgi:hypothetical protein
MKTLLIILGTVVLSAVDYGTHSSSAFGAPPQDPLRVIADVHATTNELIHALQALQASKSTNEPPEFWSAIANSTNYNVDHRRRAVLQLFARHFKPGMTIHQIALLLNHPTWLVRSGCSYFTMGSPPPGGNINDNWGGISILFNQHKAPVIWFRFKQEVSDTGVYLFQSLEGEPVNTEVDNIKVMGIVSEEILPGSNVVFDQFGIPARSSALGGEQ